MKPLLLPLLLLVLAGCSTDPQTEILEIHPTRLQLVSHDSATARVHVLMTLGPDGCHSFNEARSEARDGTQHIRFFSEHLLNSTCTLAFIDMNDTITIQRHSNTNKLQFTLASGEDTTMILK
jgi:hypothetical protein